MLRSSLGFVKKIFTKNATFLYECNKMSNCKLDSHVIYLVCINKLNIRRANLLKSRDAKL